MDSGRRGWRVSINEVKVLRRNICSNNGGSDLVRQLSVNPCTFNKDICRNRSLGVRINNESRYTGNTQLKSESLAMSAS